MRAKTDAVHARARRFAVKPPKGAPDPGVEVYYSSKSPEPVQLLPHPTAKASFGKRAKLCMIGTRFIGAVFPKGRDGWIGQIGGSYQDGFKTAGEAVEYLVECARGGR